MSMNVLTYNPDALTKYTVIPLGRACECRATRIEFMVQGWLARFPGGEIALYIKDPNGEMYLADIRTADGVASWVLHESDTQVPGYGALELALIGENGAKKLSAVATTKLEASLVQSEADAEYMQPWIERAAEIQAETAAAAKSAATHAAIASSGASNAVEAQEAAENAAEAAEDAAKAAAESAQAAGAAVEAVAAHAQDAADSAQGAAAAEAAAADSAQAAEGHANAAAAESRNAATARDAATEAATAAADHAQAAQAAAALTAALAGQTAPGIPAEASGDAVRIADAAERPAVAVVSTIAPVQGGNPVTAATLYHSGRNLFDASNFVRTDFYINGMVLSNTQNRSIRLPIAPGMTYTVRKGVATSMRVGTCVDVPAIGVALTSVVRHPTASDAPLTITAGSADRWMIVQLLVNDDFGAGIRVDDCVPSLMIEYGDTASPYEAYKGDTLTADLPAPCYGGRLDWLAGVLTVTHDNTGAELAEPITHQLTAQQLSMHKGVNAVWSDAGSTAVEYIADTKMYIDAKVAEIAASILNV